MGNITKSEQPKEANDQFYYPQIRNVLEIKIAKVDEAIASLNLFVKKYPDALLKMNKNEYYWFGELKKSGDFVVDNDCLPVKSPDPKITKAQLNALKQLAKHDLHTVQLADKLCRSHATIAQHLGQARKCLGKRTNIGAVIHCLKRRYFNLDSL